MFESTPPSGQFLSFNAQSLFNKTGELECLVNSMNPDPLVISVTKTWCLEKDTDSFYQLPNYQILRRDRTQRQRGVYYCTFIHRQQQKILVCILWKRQTKTSGLRFAFVVIMVPVPIPADRMHDISPSGWWWRKVNSNIWAVSDKT